MNEKKTAWAVFFFDGDIFTSLIIESSKKTL